MSKPNKIHLTKNVHGLKGEDQVVLRDEYGNVSIVIHPWARIGELKERQVYIGIGVVNKLGQNKDPDGMESSIFDRAAFVDALLLVFPELARF